MTEKGIVAAIHELCATAREAINRTGNNAWATNERAEILKQVIEGLRVLLDDEVKR